MRAPSARLFLLAGDAALALAALVLAGAAVSRAIFPAAVGLLVAWAALTSSGLLAFYVPAFAKRETRPLAWILVPLALVAAVLPLAGASWGLLAFAWGATWLSSSLAGTRIGERVPMPSREGAYRAADRAAALAATLAFGFAAAGGAWLAFGALSEGAWSAIALLAVGAAPLLGFAGAFHVLPRAAKRPVFAFLPQAAVLLQVAAAIALAAGLRLVAYAALAAAAILFAAFVASARPIAGAQGRALRAAAVPAAALLLAAPAAGWIVREGAALAASAAASALLLAGLTYALAPVMMNALPFRRGLSGPLAWLVVVALALFMPAVLGLADARGAFLVLALACAAHAANVAGMRKPRRGCAP